MQLNPFHQNFRRKAKDKRDIRAVRKHADHTIGISYPKNEQSELVRLCELYGSDKGALTADNRMHNYTDFYEMLFHQNRLNIKHVFECGLGRDDQQAEKVKGSNGFPGASLRVWRDYFPNAQIVGADILENVLFSEDRIETYCVDQTDPKSIVDFISKLGGREFNIIIDDGLHEYHAGITLFENMIGMLSNDGIYIVEDVRPMQLREYAKYFQFKEGYCVRFINLHRPQRRLLDNSLLWIVKNETSKAHISLSRIEKRKNIFI